MSIEFTTQPACGLSRRELLRRSGTGFGMLGLAGLLIGERADAASSVNPLAAKSAQFEPRAKRVVHLFMNGGPSQVDTFDYKPELEKRHGQPMPEGISGLSG